ncbi:MAG: BREX-1 system adenine-specific DNA-methyltransferase PglX [Acidobacteriota bacterium]|nr:BREX-1 system adenine-specific DNA-methyltransferase PglX [Acidobacteriota bacterium]
MNKAKLKSYAPQARRDFIQMIRQRADLLGLTKKEIPTALLQGDVAIIEGRPYQKNYADSHRKLAAKIKVEGLKPFVERIAYSWFNRFAALRFMEVNNFLSHGFRVLSNREAGKNEPEILTHAAEIDLPGLDKNKVIELKLAGNKDAELYRLLLIAQCNELHRAMPFLFEKINDETEILLPDNLLHSDSVIRKMVGAIDEADWAEVEIIGWLYQFYISEKKDEVIGKTVKSEDIPAATQLFTPNWIVKYMTQNSLGRLWLEANPHSQLAANMEFYIRNADGSSAPRQSGANDALVGAESREGDGRNVADAPLADEPSALRLNPEEIKVLDPACGSGHILVEAYELLKQIYTERGYSSRDIPLLILEKNLFGLDIDERAAQMASFALLMKARRDDRRIFEKLSLVSSPSSFAQDKQPSEGQRTKDKGQIPNILTVPDSSHLPNTAGEIAELFFSRGAQAGAVPIRGGSEFLFDEMQVQPSLMTSGAGGFEGGSPHVSKGGNDTSAKEYALANARASDSVTEQNVIDLLELFEQGKTLGSLIRIPHGFAQVVDRLETAVEAKRIGGDTFEQVAVKMIEPFVRAAKMLANKYDCVIANPPYMGGKGMNGELKAFAAKNFPDSKSDLFAMFIERGFELLKKDGFNAMVTMESWMFLSSYESFRENLLDKHTILSLLHLPYDGKGPTAMGISFGISVFITHNRKFNHYKASFSCSRYFELNENGSPLQFPTRNERLCKTDVDNFEKISGSPIAYWISDKMREVFENGTPLGTIVDARSGMASTDNNRFLRRWFEIEESKFSNFCKTKAEATQSGKKWFPYKKGGDYRKWYGDYEYVLNWKNDGEEIKLAVVNNPKDPNTTHWSRRIFGVDYFFKKSVTWSAISSGSFSCRVSADGSIFSNASNGVFSESRNLTQYAGFLNTNIVGNMLKVISPTLNYTPGDISKLPFLEKQNREIESEIELMVEEAVAIARADWDSFETSWDFKRLPIADCGLRSRSTSVEECWRNWKNLCDERISRMQQLETENNRLFIEAYGLEDELFPKVPLEQITLVRADAEKDTRRLLSYFVGCLMGRYSLDEEGLIYADAGGKGFDGLRYQTFPADDDGIVPVTDIEWFPTDAARQFEQFVRVAFSGNLATERTENTEEMKPQISTDEHGFSEKTSVNSVNSVAKNLQWIAAQIGAKANETPIETVRRYFSTSFFKDHLQTYKKRPIYWLFSSGKQKAFECLVYLHRYDESTLPRMRHEYVLPLMSKLEAQIETLAGKSNEYGTRSGGLIDSADSTSDKNKLRKQLEVLQKKQIELIQFDEKLRHYADMRISLDLDDGVKVNYGKFGDLLAEVKQVATTKE